MTAHALFEECDRPWNHDACPGRRGSSGPGSSVESFDPATTLIGGDIVCHCPCHGLKRQIAKLREDLGHE